MYHVMNRGDRGERIFLDDINRHDFIKTLVEVCQKTGWQVHAYCLMSNHFHLALETPEPNLVPGMAWLQSTGTIRLNNRHRLHGHVFSGRCKTQLVESSGNVYFRTACDYIHLNPVRARLVKPDERLLACPWSSLAAYVAAPEHRPSWIRVDRLLGEHGLREDSAACREGFKVMMERRRSEETDPEIHEPLRGGWCFGNETFGQAMLRRAEGSLGEIMPGNCIVRPPMPGQRESSPRNSSATVGLSETSWHAGKSTRQSWPLPRGCGARRLCRSRRLLPGYALELPNLPTANCINS
jgi:REP element-mobilizing transposase RayT